ncbi:unnamed protein product, partial [Closterium sp. NIES-54]
APVFAYAIDIDAAALAQAFTLSATPPRKRRDVALKAQVVLPEPPFSLLAARDPATAATPAAPPAAGSSAADGAGADSTTSSSTGAPTGAVGAEGKPPRERTRNVVVGMGPAGLLAALVLAEAGEQVIVVERGQPVEERGRDIGALAVRHVLNPDSNFCYGEGGAGTWSDGKLTTRIGKNSQDVREVLNVLVRMGAPERILVDGRPHLGTDRLVRILQQFRTYLLGLGVEIRFGTVVEDLEVWNGRVAGVRVRPAGSAVGSGAEGQSVIAADRVLLGVGHSARAVFDMLLSHNVLLSPKDFAVGFRIEHPQREINAIRVRGDHSASSVFFVSLVLWLPNAGGATQTAHSCVPWVGPNSPPSPISPPHLSPPWQYRRWQGSMDVEAAVARGKGPIPVADYSLAGQISLSGSTTGSTVSTGSSSSSDSNGSSSSGQQERSCYSFCMCPGGQVVCTSVTADELCLNGMSFSNRSSLWANAALVSSVSASAGDFDEFTREHGALAGMEYQETPCCESPKFAVPTGEGLRGQMRRVSCGHDTLLLSSFTSPSPPVSPTVPFLPSEGDRAPGGSDGRWGLCRTGAACH